MKFTIYEGREEVEQVEAQDERAALLIFAEGWGWVGTRVKRDGGGLLYVGDAKGRFRARRVVDPAESEAWASRFTHGQPFGMPVVLAEAIESVGGL